MPNEKIEVEKETFLTEVVEAYNKHQLERPDLIKRTIFDQIRACSARGIRNLTIGPGVGIYIRTANGQSAREPNRQEFDTIVDVLRNEGFTVAAAGINWNVSW
jgi:hypothetical protein